ncbi:MAG: hypothetical protein ACTSU5_06800 [Promethearchaeota archaeon]
MDRDRPAVGVTGTHDGTILFAEVFLGAEFFYQATRELLIGRNIANTLIPLFGAFILSVGLSGYLAKRVNWKFLAGTAGLLLALGRVLISLPQPDPSYAGYFTGMYLLWVGFPCLVIPALLAPLSIHRGKEHSSPPKEAIISKIEGAAVVSGLVGAVGYNVLFRQVGVANGLYLTVPLAIFLATCSTTVLISWIRGRRRSRAAEHGELGEIPPRGSRAGDFAFVSTTVASWIFLLLPFSNPEVFAFQSSTPYTWTALVVVGAVMVATLGGHAWLTREERGARPVSFGIVFVFLAGVPMLALGLVSQVPRGTWYLVLVASGALGAVFPMFLAYGRILEENAGHPVLSATLSTFFGVVSVLALRFVQLEAHLPWIYWIPGAVLVCGTAFSYFAGKNIPRGARGLDRDDGRREGRKNIPRGKNIPLLRGKKYSPREKYSPTSREKIFPAVLVAFSLLPVGLLFPLAAMRNGGTGWTPGPEHLVQACLYTWYGTPDGPAGHYFLRALQRTSNLDGWDASNTTMASFHLSNETGPLNLTGTTEDGKGDLVVGYGIRNLAGASRINPVGVRTYFEVNASSLNSTCRVHLQVRKDGVTYSSEILNSSDTPGTFHLVRRVFPVHFETKYLDPGPDMIRLNQTSDAPAPGTYTLLVTSLNLSQWTHYNEDYHSYQDPVTGFWYNDPPGHSAEGSELGHGYKATAHSAYYGGTPWTDIPAYGMYDHSKWEEPPFTGENARVFGIYDSLNETVIEAQLKLMERAGIDTCVIMHPWGIDVAETILRVADVIHSNLTFSYYGGFSDIGDVMESLAPHEKWLRTEGGLPVYYLGPTGLLEEPYPDYIEKANQVRTKWNVFLVGDLYSSPYTRKEEMLNVVDAWYYYDTSAFYRHGWGDPQVDAYQPDGSVTRGHGDLSELFGEISSMVHGHGKLYVATLIPGTDNTCVHDFTRSPLADGRPGTINARAGGLTFNDTWNAAIEAGADWVNIVSWNELHEGTEIEPTLENGTYHLELNRVWADLFHGDS